MAHFRGGAATAGSSPTAWFAVFSSRFPVTNTMLPWDDIPEWEDYQQQHDQAPSGSSHMDLNLMEMNLDDIPERYLSPFSTVYDPKRVHNLNLSRNNLLCLRGMYAFENLVSLDVSNNSMSELPEDIGNMKNLRSLIARNNLIEDVPKSMYILRDLETINLSGNRLEVFPSCFLSMGSLKVLHLGANRIETLPYQIGALNRLIILYLGGNRLKDVPATIGMLHNLTSLALCDNELETIPPTVAELQRLESLSLHNNNLTTLPTEIVKLRNLQQLSLRNNPLVHNFVSNMELEPPKLKEIAGRLLQRKLGKWRLHELLPTELLNYLSSANQCVNPKCKGVYFEACVEHVKFVDFCGKYRVPLLQFLCSPKCSGAVPAYEGSSSSDTDDEGQPRNMKMKKVLLG